MNCLKCDGRSRVMDSRSDRTDSEHGHAVNYPGSVYRRRRCDNCGIDWKTIEIRDDELATFQDPELRDNLTAANAKLATVGRHLRAAMQQLGGRDA